MPSKNVRISTNPRPTLVSAGAHRRLLCLTGSNKGTYYYIEGKRVIIGRSEDSDILILDSNASKKHAELVNLKDQLVITDLNTKNGTYVNRSQINQYHLNEGDNIIIGKTVYKFQTIFKEENIIEKAKKQRSTDEETTKDNKTIQKKRRPIVLLVAVLLGVLFLLDEEPSPNKTNLIKHKSHESKQIQTFQKKSSIDKSIKRTLAAYLHRGIREYREENYLQAIREFNMALTLDPTGERASFYKRKAVKKIEKTVENLFIQASRERAILRYQAALVSLCGIVKILSYYEYKGKKEQAKKIIQEIQSEIGNKNYEDTCSV